MAARGNSESKLYRESGRAINTKRKQTPSGGKGSLSRFGTPKSSQSTDSALGVIRATQAMSVGASRRRKITLAPLPWDDKS